jgi:DNA primase catalytic core
MKSKIISKMFIEDLVERVDITDLIDNYLPLKKAGKNFSACCPFHSEKTPSFTSNSEKGLFYCFGCGANGNAINFLMEFSNIDFPSAVETLASFAGIDVQYETKNLKLYAEEEEQEKLLSLLNGYFQNQILENKESISAVGSNLGLRNTDLSEISGAGFLPSANKLTQFINDNDLFNLSKKHGVINKKDKLISLSNAATFPITFKGKTKGFVSLNSKGKQLTIPGKIVFDEKSSLVGLAEAKGNDNDQPIYVVSSFSEKLKLEDMGISNVICNVYRNSPLTKSQYRSVTSKNQKDIFFVFENNEASRDSTLQLVESFVSGWNPNQSSEIKVLFIPENESLSTIIKKVSIDKIGYLQSKAIDLPTYFLSSLDGNMSSGDVNELVSHVAPVLQSAAGVARYLHDALMDELIDTYSVDRNEFISLYTEYLFDKNPYHWFLHKNKNQSIKADLVKHDNFDIKGYIYGNDDENHLVLSSIYEVACAGGLSNQDIKILRYIPAKASESELLNALSDLDLSDESIVISDELLAICPDAVDKVKAEQGNNEKTPIFNEHVVDELLVISFDRLKSVMRKNSNSARPNSP